MRPQTSIHQTAPQEPFILGKLSTLFWHMEILGSCQKDLMSLGAHFSLVRFPDPLAMAVGDSPMGNLTSIREGWHLQKSKRPSLNSLITLLKRWWTFTTSWEPLFQSGVPQPGCQTGTKQLFPSFCMLGPVGAKPPST